MKLFRFVLALLIVVLLTSACVQLAFVLEPGLPGGMNTLEERQAFVEANLIRWQLGWVNWMMAALGLLTFCILLLPFIPASEWRTCGILLVALGIAPDLSAEVIFAFVLPHAHLNDPSLANYALLESLAIQLTGTLGNGLYNLGGLLLNSLLLQNARVPRQLILVGIPAWLLGIGLSVATATQQLDLATFFTGTAMVWSTLWMLAIALKVFRQEDHYRIG